MVSDEAGYGSQIDAVKERILTARANAAANRAILTDALTAWFPHWAVATARRIVEDQHENTTRNPDGARTLRDVVLATDWSGSARDTIGSLGLDAGSDADFETDRIVRLRLMFAGTREGEVPDWLNWALDRLTDAFVEIVSAGGYVPMLYEMAPQLAGQGRVLNPL